MYVECDKCHYLLHIPEGSGYLSPEGEPMTCPYCKEGTMKDHGDLMTFLDELIKVEGVG